MPTTFPQYGEIVASQKSAGYITLSYVVSFIGCLTALELLHRRTHNGGRYNWFLLIGAAIAMGAVAIWSMHFIGMEAIIMANGEPELQIVYSPSFTVGSIFLPIGVVGFAFWIISSSSSSRREASPWRIALGGLVSGTAICGMHYLGQAGMLNYDNVWNWRFILASAIIAVTAATIALGVFFYLKSKWINALWKRTLCALSLAVAVSLMHWTAIIGTGYSWRGMTGYSSVLTRTSAVWICGALALSCCIVLLTFAILFQFIRRKYLQKAQQVSIALAYWDPNGKLMINAGGLLPSSKITKSYLERSSKDTFDTEHPIFSWMFRVTRHWPSVYDLVPSMRQHVRVELEDDTASLSGTNSKDQDYASLIKQLFCVACADLALLVDEPLKNVGVLYDRIINTSSLSTRARLFAGSAPPPTVSTTMDLENGITRPVALGRGQLMFLVRHVSRSEASKMQSLGFNFAPVDYAVSQLAQSMQITPAELSPYLNDLRAYQEMPTPLEPGVHVACFALHPVIGGFEVLTRKDLRNQLPSIKVSDQKLQRWQTIFLSAYENWEMQSLMSFWDAESTQGRFTGEQKAFVRDLCTAMRKLQVRLGDKLFRKSRLIAKPMEAPCGRSVSKLEYDEPQNGMDNSASLITFRIVADIHYIHPATAPDAFLPSRLFLTQQHCYEGSPDHTVFSGHVHQEFSSPAYIAPHRKAPAGLSKMTSTKLRTQRSRFSIKGRSEPSSPITLDDGKSSLQLDNASEKHLVTAGQDNPFGGVHVSNEITISVVDADPTQSKASIEMDNLGLRTEIGRQSERDSVMDVLMNVTLGGLKG